MRPDSAGRLNIHFGPLTPHSVIFAGLVGFGPLACWLCLLLGRHGFWRFRERDDLPPGSPPVRWPSVTAVVPARNEAEVIATSLRSLLAQDYPGIFRIVVVDDQSDDGTADQVRSLASDRITLVPGTARPADWKGKPWAMRQGFDPACDFLWFTDADIAHRPDTLATLVARAEAAPPRALVSLMAELSCATPAERFLIPAFVYFFAMLYPFGAVNDPRRRLAAAAGGCMLVRTECLVRAGGLEGIRGALIDDCALAARLKSQSPIWLGLTRRSMSLRPYGTLHELRRMVARSAYTQLRHSPLLLGGTLAALGLIFVAPVLAAAFAHGFAQAAGIAAWLLMAATLQPILAFYRRSPLWGLALPAIAACYAAFTLDSAIQHWRGRGGLWKNRIQSAAG